MSKTVKLNRRAVSLLQKGDRFSVDGQRWFTVAREIDAGFDKNPSYPRALVPIAPVKFEGGQVQSVCVGLRYYGDQEREREVFIK